MPRKAPYEPKKVPYVEVYPKLIWEDTYEAMKKEAAKHVNEMIGWSVDQRENNPDGSIEVYDQLGYFNVVNRAKNRLDGIYYRNRAIPEAELKAEMARLAGDQSEFDKWTAKAEELEDEVASLVWRIYKDYCKLKEAVVFRTKQEIRKANQEAEESDPNYEYEQDDADLEKIGGV